MSLLERLKAFDGATEKRQQQKTPSHSPLPDQKHDQRSLRDNLREDLSQDLGFLAADEAPRHGFLASNIVTPNSSHQEAPSPRHDLTSNRSPEKRAEGRGLGGKLKGFV